MFLSLLSAYAVLVLCILLQTCYENDYFSTIYLWSNSHDKFLLDMESRSWDSEQAISPFCQINYMDTNSLEYLKIINEPIDVKSTGTSIEHKRLYSLLLSDWSRQRSETAESSASTTCSQDLSNAYSKCAGQLLIFNACNSFRADNAGYNSTAEPAQNPSLLLYFTIVPTLVPAVVCVAESKSDRNAVSSDMSTFTQRELHNRCRNLAESTMRSQISLINTTSHVHNEPIVLQSRLQLRLTIFIMHSLDVNVHSDSKEAQEKQNSTMSDFLVNKDNILAYLEHYLRDISESLRVRIFDQIQIRTRMRTCVAGSCPFQNQTRGAFEFGRGSTRGTGHPLGTGAFCPYVDSCTQHDISVVFELARNTTDHRQAYEHEAIRSSHGRSSMSTSWSLAQIDNAKSSNNWRIEFAIREISSSIRTALGLPVSPMLQASILYNGMKHKDRVGWLPASKDNGFVHEWELLWLQNVQYAIQQKHAAQLLLLARHISTSSVAGGEVALLSSRSTRYVPPLDNLAVQAEHTVRPSIYASELFEQATGMLERLSNLNQMPHTISNSTNPSSRGQHSSFLVDAYSEIRRAVALAQRLARDPSLLPTVHFPWEQVVSIYAPYWIPCFVPVLRAGYRVYTARKMRVSTV